MSIQISVPNTVNLSQYTDVQRGTIFLMFVTILLIFISNCIRIVANQLDLN